MRNLCELSTMADHLHSTATTTVNIGLAHGLRNTGVYAVGEFNS